MWATPSFYVITCYYIILLQLMILMDFNVITHVVFSIDVYVTRGLGSAINKFNSAEVPVG